MCHPYSRHSSEFRSPGKVRIEREGTRGSTWNGIEWKASKAQRKNKNKAPIVE
jgi:hypothetical protein